MSADHQIGAWPLQGMSNHRTSVGHPAPCSASFIHYGFGDRFLDRIGNDTRQRIHPFHQGTNVQRAEEVTIEPRDAAEAAEAVAQEHLHAHEPVYPRQGPDARLREEGRLCRRETAGGPFPPSRAVRGSAPPPDGRSTGEPEW